jgi:hypothetical protein
MLAKIFGTCLAILLIAGSLAAQSGDGDCQFRLDVFLDRSGSVQQLRSTGKSSYQEVLEALKEMLATSPNHLLDENDGVQVEHFPQLETRSRILVGPEEVAKRISELVDQPAPSTPFTDLREPFHEVSGRASNRKSVAHRQIFLIVSDFLHDPEGGNDPQDLAEEELNEFINNRRADLEKAFPSPPGAGAASVRQASDPLPLAGSQETAPPTSPLPHENLLLLYTLGVSKEDQVRKQQQFLASLGGIHFQQLRSLRDLERAIIEHSFRVASEVVWDVRSASNKDRQAKVTLVNRNCSAFTICQVWVECLESDKVSAESAPFVLQPGATSEPIPVKLGSLFCSQPVVKASSRYGAAKDGRSPRSCSDPEVLPLFEELPLVGDGSPPEMRAVQAAYEGGWLTSGRLQLNLELRGRFETDHMTESAILVKAIGLGSSVKVAPVALPKSMTQGCEDAHPSEVCLDARKWHPFRCTLDLGRQALPKFAYLPLDVEWKSGSRSDAQDQPTGDYKSNLPSVSNPTFVALSIPAFLWAFTLFVLWATGESLTMATVASMVTIVGASSLVFGVNYLVNPAPGFEDIRRFLFCPEFLLTCLIVVCVLWGLLTLRRHRLEHRSWLRAGYDFVPPFVLCFLLIFGIGYFFPMFVGDIKQRWGENQAVFESKWGDEICVQEGDG